MALQTAWDRLNGVTPPPAAAVWEEPTRISLRAQRPPEPVAEQQDQMEKVFSFRQLRDNPDLRSTPERLGHFAWRGKLSILSSLHKLGRKSSVVGQDAAEATKRGSRVIVFNYDEDAQDSYDRWTKHGADPDLIYYAGWISSTDAMEEIIDKLEIDYVVIDSLSTWLSGTGEEVPNSWDNVAAQALANRLKRIAVEHDCGVCVIAHAGQNDQRGRIAGTAGYGAAADMMIEIPPPSTIASAYRNINFLGRWKEEPMRIAFDDDNVFSVVKSSLTADAPTVEDLTEGLTDPTPWAVELLIDVVADGEQTGVRGLHEAYLKAAGKKLRQFGIKAVPTLGKSSISNLLATDRVKEYVTKEAGQYTLTEAGQEVYDGLADL